eukprot:EG_transcript_4026
MPSIDWERFLGRCILQEIAVRCFWQKSLEQLRGVHTHDKCNLLSEQQQELSELLSRHARQRAQLRQAHLHQKQEHFEKQDKQLRGLYRSLRHILEIVRLPNHPSRDKQQDVAQWCDAVLQASPAPKRRRQSSPTPSVDVASELGGAEASISPLLSNGSILPPESQSSTTLSIAPDQHPSLYWPPYFNGAVVHQTEFPVPPAPNKGVELSPSSSSPAATGSVAVPSHLEVIVGRLRKLQATQEEQRCRFEEEAKEVEDERHMNDYELEVEKLRQQKQQKQQLLFTLCSERNTQRTLLSVLRQNGGVKRPAASDGERESYSRFQQHLLEQIRFRQRQLREVRAETHRVTKVQRYRRWMEGQSESAAGGADCVEEDQWSSSSLSSSSSETCDQVEEEAGRRTASVPKVRPKAPEAGEEGRAIDDDDSDRVDEDEDSEGEPADPVKVLLCTYDECLTDLVFGEDEDEEEEGDYVEAAE